MFQEPRETAVCVILVLKAFVTALTLHVIAMVCEWGALQNPVWNTMTSL